MVSGLPVLVAEEPVARGTRQLGISITEAGDNDYGVAFDVARRAGMQVTSLSLAWDEIEAAPGVFANDFLAIANAFYPATDTSIDLVLAVIDTNNSRLPADLMGRRYDDPLVISRFNALLDWVFGQIPDLDLASLAIGNEVDALLAGPGLDEYRAFLAPTAAHARGLRTGLPVGVVATLYGLTGPESAALQRLNQVTDLVIATYYPLAVDFTVKDPAVVPSEIEDLVSLYPGRRIAIAEAGYPSGALCRSSEDLQARFVGEIFRTWDLYADQIDQVTFTWLNDISAEDVDFFVDYYGLNDPVFAEYLKTLGLRRRPGSGTPKRAFHELRAQAALRGWAVVGATLPVTPERLSARPLGNDRIELEWRHQSSGEEEYQVEMAPTSEPFRLVATVPRGELSVVVGDLDPSSAYRFRARAANASGTSAWSNVAMAVTGENEECDAGFFSASAFAGFCFRVVLTPPGGEELEGMPVSSCLQEAVCVQGAVVGRTEVLIRIVGPKPNGYLWPTLVKLTTSEVDVTIRRPSTGEEQSYTLRGARPGFDELPGLFDREGFLP